MKRSYFKLVLCTWFVLIDQYTCGHYLYSKLLKASNCMLYAIGPNNGSNGMVGKKDIM